MMKFKSLFRRQAPGASGKGLQQNGKTGTAPHQQQQQVSWCLGKTDPGATTCWLSPSYIRITIDFLRWGIDAFGYI